MSVHRALDRARVLGELTNFAVAKRGNSSDNALAGGMDNLCDSLVINAAYPIRAPVLAEMGRNQVKLLRLKVDSPALHRMNIQANLYRNKICQILMKKLHHFFG